MSQYTNCIVTEGMSGWGLYHNTQQCIVTSRGRMLSFLYYNTHSVLWLGKDLGLRIVSQYNRCIVTGGWLGWLGVS